MGISDSGRVLRIIGRELEKFRETSLSQISREKDPFQVLVSCIISLRTKDQVTSEASKRLFKLARSPKRMLTLSEEQIQKAIYPAAFFRVKARNIKKVSRILLEKHKGKVPSTIDELLELPGVGRKTANICLVFGFHKDGIPVDVHVHRISNRLGWLETKTPDETEFALRKNLPKKHWQELYDYLVSWGQNICAPISPWCSRCPIKSCKRIGVGKSR